MSSALTKKHLMAKARGFTDSIEKMDQKQRVERPSGSYGQDYNKLRDLTIRLNPDLSEILPPPVNVFRTSIGSDITDQNYGEIHTYCEQIFQLLSEQQ